MAGNADNIILGAAVINLDATDVGYTSGPTTIRYEPTWVEIEAEQAVGVVSRKRSNERLFVTMTLLEPTLENMRISFNYPEALLDGSTLTLGYNSSCVVQEQAMTIITVGPSCGSRTFTFPTAVAVGEKEYTMSKEEPVQFEVEFEILKASDGTFGTVVDG